MVHLYHLTNSARKNYYQYNAGVRGSTIQEEPEIINREGEVAYLIDGFAIEGQNKKVVQFGILQVDLSRRYDRGQNVALAQFDRIVLPGLILVEHIFRGLKRPLFKDGSPYGDSEGLIHTWRPLHDYEWPDKDKTGRPIEKGPVASSVFAVIINMNHHREKWPEVYGWIDRWNWIYEDAYLPGAPMNWKTRYEEKLL